MHELLTALLALLLVLMGFAMMLGLPPGRVLRVVGKWGAMLVVASLLILQAPALLEHFQRQPPRSLQELAVWLGVAFVLFLVVLRMLFGPGAVGRFFERIMTAAVYDLLKGLTRLLLGRRR